jgi:hypothetical protein
LQLGDSVLLVPEASLSHGLGDSWSSDYS